MEIEHRYLTYLKNGYIVSQIEAEDVSREEAIALDDMLREQGVIGENEEIAITKKVSEK